MKLLHSTGPKINLFLGLAIILFFINACSNSKNSKEDYNKRSSLRKDSVKFKGNKPERRNQLVSTQEVSYSDQKIKIEVFGRVNSFSHHFNKHI